MRLEGAEEGRHAFLRAGWLAWPGPEESAALRVGVCMAWFRPLEVRHRPLDHLPRLGLGPLRIKILRCGRAASSPAGTRSLLRRGAPHVFLPRPSPAEDSAPPVLSSALWEPLAGLGVAGDTRRDAGIDSSNCCDDLVGMCRRRSSCLRTLARQRVVFRDPPRASSLAWRDSCSSSCSLGEGLEEARSGSRSLLGRGFLAVPLGPVLVHRCRSRCDGFVATTWEMLGASESSGPTLARPGAKPGMIDLVGFSP